MAVGTDDVTLADLFLDPLQTECPADQQGHLHVLVSAHMIKIHCGKVETLPTVSTRSGILELLNEDYALLTISVVITANSSLHLLLVPLIPPPFVDPLVLSILVRHHRTLPDSNLFCKGLSRATLPVCPPRRGAEGGSRTPTGLFAPPAPQAGASTNSATSAWSGERESNPHNSGAPCRRLTIKPSARCAPGEPRTPT